MIPAGAVNQFLEFSLVATCVCGSWFILSQLFVYLELSKKEKQKITLASRTDVINGGSASSWAFVQGEEEGDAPVPPAVPDGEDAAVALFEHYGIFGALPGAWSSDCAVDVFPVFARANQEEVGRDGKSLPGAILEHYDVFDANLGTWSNSRMLDDSPDPDSTNEEESGRAILASRPTTEGVSAATLFEHYSLFRAAPGAWA